MSDLASLLTDKHLGYALELVLSNVIQNNVRKVNKRSVASYVSAHDELSKAVEAADADTLGAFAAFVNDAVDVTAIALKTKAKRDTKKKGTRRSGFPLRTFLCFFVANPSGGKPAVGYDSSSWMGVSSETRWLGRPSGV